MRSRWMLALVFLAFAACKKGDAKQTPAVDATMPAQTSTAAQQQAAACASRSECPSGSHCTTEDGACNRPPGCGPEDMCAQVCYGVCAQGAGGAGSMSCAADADCRTFSDYCTACDCRALHVKAPDPKCDGPGVRCLVDPCQHKSARCQSGQCVVAGGSAE